MVLVAVGEEVLREEEGIELLHVLRRHGVNHGFNLLQTFVQPDREGLGDVRLVLLVASEAVLKELDDAPASLGVVREQHHDAQAQRRWDLAGPVPSERWFEILRITSTQVTEEEVGIEHQVRVLFEEQFDLGADVPERAHTRLAALNLLERPVIRKQAPRGQVAWELGVVIVSVEVGVVVAIKADLTPQVAVSGCAHHGPAVNGRHAIGEQRVAKALLLEDLSVGNLRCHRVSPVAERVLAADPVRDVVRVATKLRHRLRCLLAEPQETECPVVRLFAPINVLASHCHDTDDWMRCQVAGAARCEWEQ